MNMPILLSVRPEWVVKILNGEKTIEVRKKFPKDFVGWVYIYCTKNGKKPYDGAIPYANDEGYCLVNKSMFPYNEYGEEGYRLLNGKVVARFWCDNVEEIYHNKKMFQKVDTNGFRTVNETQLTLLKRSCLTINDLQEYLKVGTFDSRENFKCGYAIRIYFFQLEIFDKPRDISEFYCNYTHNDYKKGIKTNYIKEPNILIKKLTKAPQNYCFVEEIE